MTKFAIKTLLLLLSSATLVQANDVDFEREVRPLLMVRCAKCHGPVSQKGGLRLDAKHFAFKGGDSGEVIAAAKSDESELMRRVESEDDAEWMPPEGPRLSADEIGVLRRWIDGGASWPETQYDRDARRDRRLEHWAFQPLKSPPVRDGKPANRIDEFIAAGHQREGLQFSRRASPRILLRRLLLDVTGLPPTPDDFRRLEADADPDAWQNAVEAALASPRYGERWAQHWLDVVRYADTHGFEVNTPRENAWPYRDYVIRAFNEDKPYDRFVREQLVGDALGADEATGFLVAAAVLLPGQIGKDEPSKRLARQDSLDEMIQGAGATMLGLTIGCARCHDHKFDPISQRDYYAMQAFFAGVDYGDRPVSADADPERRQKSQALAKQIDRLEQELRQFEPYARGGTTLIIDEEDKARVEFLQKENGPGANPAGKSPGYRDDVGAVDRVPNISRGRYTWWNNKPGEDVAAYAPGVEGQFSLWISWGAHGSGVHTRDARYVLDLDGDLATQGDQRELAKVDQYYRAGVTAGETEMKPLWSGLRYVGVIDWRRESKLVVRGGETGTGITADVIVLQEAPSAALSRKSQKLQKSNTNVNVDVNLPHLRAPVSPARNTERFAPQMARFVRLTTLETIDDNRHEPCIDELEVYGVEAPATNAALASSGAKATSSGNYSETGKHQLKHVNDGVYGNDRSWISNKHGGGWVQIELTRPLKINRVVWGRDRTGKFKDRLPIRYRLDVSEDGQTWRRVAGHEDRAPTGSPYDLTQALQRIAAGEGAPDKDLPAKVEQLSRMRGEHEKLIKPQMVYAGVFRKPDATRVLRRGDPEQPGDPIGPAVPALFQASPLSPELGDRERRAGLADWLASPENPLTARVMVNRIWAQHFGRGLVATPSDFGLNGARPTHPELLDWLASEFINSGWSVKHIHRLILNSRTYQQGNRVDAELAKLDADNRWLWRFSPRRLEGEAIRDSLLAISGELNLKMGGPGFNFFKSRGGLSGFPPVDEFRTEQMRRMIYAHKIRMERVPVFGAFDCPDAGQSTPMRSRSTTAVQALNLFNSPFVMGRAKKFASRIQESVGDDVSYQVKAAFQLALGRPPTRVEQVASVTVVKEHGLASLCRVIFNSNEFLFLP